MFDIVKLQDGWSRSMEQMGTKRKFWYAHHEDEESESRWLFKYAREGTGEDWAEKIAEYLCRNLGLPHARYELAEAPDGVGVVSPSFLRAAEQLVLGNQLLAAADHDYSRRRTFRDNSPHTVEAVLFTLSEVGPPRMWNLPSGIRTAPEVFVGYLLLDALIGNGDRHDENWGVVAGTTGAQRSLAPTFDHASSLGRELTDMHRRERISTRDRGRSVAAYAEKGRSALYRSVGDKKPLGMVEAFAEAAVHCPDAAQSWKRQLIKLDGNTFQEGFDQIPPNRISPVACDFALSLLLLNRQRLLDTLTSE